MLVAGAGPVSNFLLAAALHRRVLRGGPRGVGEPGGTLGHDRSSPGSRERRAGIFNLVPCRPSTAPRWLRSACPAPSASAYDRIVEPYGSMILLLLMVTGVLGCVVCAPIHGLHRRSCASPSLSMARPRILSGMRPTGPLHLGHLMGALDNWVRLQDTYDCFYASWTGTPSPPTTPTPRRIRENILEVATDWLAAGLDPARSALFVQSDVKEHAELHLLLSMIMPVPWLERVPTYKEQQQQLADRDLSTYGFLGYPLLQTRRHRDLPGGRGAGGGGPGPPHRADPRGRAPLQQPLRAGVPRAEDAAHRHPAHAGHRRAEDVEVVRQRRLPEGPARGGARRRSGPW